MRPVFRFHDMIGQPRVCGYLGRLAEGARARGCVPPSILLLGPAGHGKSALAEAYANEIGTTCRAFLLGRQVTTETLVQVLRAIEDGDVLHIDEAHALGPEVGEILLYAVQERRLPVRGKPEAGPVDESVAEFTLVLATNQPSEIPGALRSRLEPVELDRYSDRELAEIVRQRADGEGQSITPQGARTLAAASQGSPRHALGLLAAAWTYCHEAERLDRGDIRSFLAAKGRDEEYLLTQQQQQALMELLRAPRHTLSAGSLARLVGVDPGYLAEDVETWLVRCALIDVAPKGRALTDRGHEVATALTRRRKPASET